MINVSCEDILRAIEWFKLDFTSCVMHTTYVFLAEQEKMHRFSIIISNFLFRSNPLAVTARTTRNYVFLKEYHLIFVVIGCGVAGVDEGT